MKKWIWLGALALLLLPQRGTEVGELLPVETLLIEKEAGQYVVSVDTGESARGSSLEAAVEAMRASAPGEMFLDTADYVLLTRDTLDCMPQLSDFVRPAARVYMVDKGPDLEEIGPFLRAQGPDAPLFRLEKGERPAPKLSIEGENWHFEGQ